MKKIKGPEGKKPAAARFDAVARMSVSQSVLDKILAEIRDGRLKPGEKLPSEHELTQQFQVGRSTIREAMRGLMTLGLVQSRQGRGAVVTAQAESPLNKLKPADLDQLNERALLDLLEVREALEGQAAEYAARRATADDVQEIRHRHLAVKRDVESGRSYFRSNAAFHQAVAVAAHNPVLAESIAVLSVQVRAYREKMMREMAMMPQRDVVEHAAILDAISEGKPERARNAMAAHIRSFVRLIERQSERKAAAQSR